MKKIYIPQGGGRDFWLRIPMNNESAGRHLCMDDVDENEMHVWLESGYGGCWTLEWEKDGAQRDGIAAKVPASQLGYGTYSVVMAGKFVNGDYFRTKRQLFIRLVDREDQADAEPTMYNEEQAYWAGPAVLSEMLSRDGLNTYELWILQGNEGTMEQFLAFHGFTLNDYMVHWNHLSVDVQTKIQRGEEKGIEVMGDYSATTTYDVNDLVFDPTTNSSYISKHASNTGNALTDTDHWMKTMDGTDVLRAIEDADDATDAANTAAATAESAAAGAVTTITEALTGYFTCGASTDKGGLQTKVVDNDHDYIKPSYGGAMKIRMYQVNTYVPTTGNPVKLKIGDETAAELLYNREPVTPDNSWEKNEVISVYYDGTYYQASNAQGGGGKAEKIKYDNSQSGLSAENVQGALDEVVNDLVNKIDGQSENDSTWDFALSDANGNIVFCIKDGHIITKNFKSSALTIGVADLDKENCAYAVTDSNGNMAFVITEDGHLVTKNFNSRNVSAESLAILEKLANLVTKFNGKTMAVIGDSISTYSGYTPSGWRVYYPTGNVNNVSATYWHQVATTLGMTPLNCAYSASYVTGDSTQTEVSSTHEQGECAGCSEVRIASLTRDGNTPDIVLILLGTNDYNAGKTLGSWTEHSAIPSEGTIGNFSSAYALMLHKIKTALPNARIFCCTILQRNFSFPEKTISVKDYNDVIKKMASIFGCDVIDTYACGMNRYNISSLTVDNALHPNAAGHKLVADKIITELISKY